MYRIVCFAALILGAISYTGWCGPKDTSEVYRALLDHGVEFIDKHASDSAMYYITLAHATGMPREKFLYYWAEICLSSGAVDSAFVLNYSLSMPSDSAFRLAVLKQRYIIYTGLGWSDKAQVLLDSIAPLLKAPAIKKSNRFLPTVDFRLQNGIVNNSQMQGNFPFPSPVTTDRTIAADLRDQLGLTWKVPLTNKLTLLPSAGYVFSSPGRKNVRPDSVGSAVTAGFMLDWNAEVNVGYDARWSGDIHRLTSFIHECALSWYAIHDSDTYILYGSFGWLQDNIGEDHGQVANALACWDHALKRGGSLTLSVLFGMQLFPALTAANPTNLMHVSFDSVAQGPQGTVIHYFLNGDPIPNAPPGALADYTENADTINMDETLQRTNYSVNPSISWRIPIARRCSFSLSTGYGFSWYPQPYTWYTIDPDAPGDYSWAQNSFPWLAYNEKDKRYYAAMAPHLISGAVGDFFLDSPVRINYHSVVRMDHSISVGMSLDRSFPNLGTLGVSVDAGRNFSTLSNGIPVAIQTWSVRFLTRYSFSWSAR